MEEFRFTTSDLKNFAWCEAIIYVKYYLGYRERGAEYMDYGKEIEKEKHVATAVRKYRATKVIKPHELVSRDLPLIGKPDYILVTKHGEYIPLEIKWATPTKTGKPKKDHLLQLSAYALLIEENWKPPERRSSVKRGCIYYLKPQGKLIEVAISYSMKKHVVGIIKRMLKIAQGLEEPKPSITKCESCGYAPYCPYRKHRSPSTK